MVTVATHDLRPLVPVSVAVAVWGLGRALPRLLRTLVGPSCCRAASRPYRFRLIRVIIG